MPSTWKPFHLHCKYKSIPPLLAKYDFGPSHYQVWLTDLSYIWTESLDRRQIVMRAFSINTSIDPSEDTTQMGLLFRSIEDALRQRPGSRVNLDRSNHIKQLTLHTSTPLPHPLRPLEWSIVLMLAPQSTFASEFVSHLLNQQLIAKAEKSSLLQQLKDKDKVISKLVDKMHGDGVDLGKVFPGAVSSKSGTGPSARRAVAKSIKGLGEFDQDQWENQLAKDNKFSKDLDDFLAQVSDDDGKDAGEGLQIPIHGEWWMEDPQRKGATPATLKTDAKQGIGVEDDFQRQSTPPNFPAQTPRLEGLITEAEPKVSSSSGKIDQDEGGSTTDESDDNLQSSHSKPLPSRSRTDDAVASGSANGSKDIHPEPMDLDADGMIAASDLDDSPTKTHSEPRSRPKLGKIGGKRKENSPEIPAVPTIKPKLGKIGGKGKLGKLGGAGSVSDKNESIPSNSPEDLMSSKREARDRSAAPIIPEPERGGRTVQRPPENLPPRETSQERANRKRAQLKRELESKSQAATKKKRRF